MKKTVKVKQKHINMAWREKSSVSCVDCPVALAMIEAGFEQVAAKADGRLYFNGQSAKTPDEVMQFIECFDDARWDGDSDRPVLGKPLVFELEVPA